MEKKYTYSEPSLEDQQAFKAGLEELCNKLSLSFNQGINKVPIVVKDTQGQPKNIFAEEPVILLQKRTEVPEEVVPNTSEPEVKVIDVDATPVEPTQETSVDPTLKQAE